MFRGPQQRRFDPPSCPIPEIPQLGGTLANTVADNADTDRRSATVLGGCSPPARRRGPAPGAVFGYSRYSSSFCT